jgi:predicted nucleotidyltransferase
MVVSAVHRRHWQQRLQAEAAALAERRSIAKLQAKVAALTLSGHWPQIRAIWLFGSVLEPGFGLQSDLDLCVQGLPSSDLLAAMELVDGMELPAQADDRRLPVDLVRFESLPPHWRQRLRERGLPLL